MYFVGILEALIGSAADRDDDAQSAIFKSLLDIGRKKHTLVLTTAHAFLAKHSKAGVFSFSYDYIFTVVKKSQGCVVEIDGEHQQGAH